MEIFKKVHKKIKDDTAILNLFMHTGARVFFIGFGRVRGSPGYAPHSCCLH